HVDVRILAATNKNLSQEIEAGNFRPDLFYRLNVVPIQVPELAERREDIPELIKSFQNQFQNKGMGKKEFSQETIRLLMQHDWPGNIRELKNMVERLLIMCPEPIIRPQDVQMLLSGSIDPARPMPEINADYLELPFKEARKRFEHDYLKARLLENKGNISKTAQQIGMERSHLHKKVKALAIEIESKKKE
ncbi:MAG: sigma-54-dependent Fis family transcriptional regulator, partial [Desulfobulbus sp.]